MVSTGDHLGRKGLGWGAGVGVVVGLFAPELLASVAVGAVGGAIVGRFAEHKIKTGLHDKLGQALPAGSAGIIAIFDDEYRLAIEQAMAGAAMRSVVQADKIGLRQLEGVAGRGDGQVQPGSDQAADPRSELRGGDRSHHRQVGAGLVHQHDPQASGRGTERGVGADR